MRAMRNRNNYLTFVSLPEGQLLEKIAGQGFVAINKLNEREALLADALYQRGLVNQVFQEHEPGYEIIRPNNT